MWSHEAPGDHHLPQACRGAATTGFCPPVSAGPQVLALPSPFSECTWGQWLEAHPVYMGLCLAVPASPPVPWEHRWDATGGTFWGFWSSAALVRGSAHRAGSHVPPFSPDPLLPPCQAPNNEHSAKPGAEPYGSTQLALRTVTQVE